MSKAIHNPALARVDDAGTNAATFVIEPLHAGYGNTLGNSLRRVLLSSIRGGAIVAFRIEGATHEFTTVEGVKEDVIDIMLNLKGVNLAVHGDQSVEARITKKGAGDVTAADIKTTADVEVINPEGHEVGPGGTGEMILTLPVPGIVTSVSAAGSGVVEEHFARHGQEVYATGDVVSVDAGGGFRFQGRADPVVSVSGQLISLQAVTQVLLDHPFVSAARTVGRRDEGHGWSVLALVVAEQAAADTAAELQAAVTDVLGGLARPRTIVFLDTIDPRVERQQLADAVSALVPPGTPSATLTWAEILTRLHLGG